MGIKFITDSASDILPSEAEENGLVVLPLGVNFGDQSYRDGVTLSHEEFYEKLATCKELPTTSQISPAMFDDKLKELAKCGDDIIIITLSSKLSGTYQSARIAAANYDNVYVVDSLNASIGQRVLIERGLELAAQGKAAGEIVGILDKEKHKIRVVAIIDTLEYLKKGGRISATTAIAGSVLAIKPAIEIKGGMVKMVGTARGSIKCNALLDKLILQYGGINRNFPVAFVYSGDDGNLTKYLSSCKAVKSIDTPKAYNLGCAIGTHVGPGAYGVAFFEK